MKTYNVIDKASGAGKFAYTADSPSFTEIYPAALYDHVPEAMATPLPVPRLIRYGGRRQITHEEMRNLFTDEERWLVDEFEAGFETMPLPDDVKNRIRSGYKSYYVAQFVNLDDPKVAMLLGVFVGLQLISLMRMEEILNG